MRGKVVWIDPNNSELIKVQFDGGRIATIELLGAEVEIEDIIIGNFANLGGEMLYNKTQEEDLDVFIQDFD